MKFRFYILTSPDAILKGTNKENLATIYSADENAIVIDTSNGQQWCDWSAIERQDIQEIKE